MSFTDAPWESFEDWLYQTAKSGDRLVVTIYPGAKQVSLRNLTRRLGIVSRPLDRQEGSHDPQLEPELRRRPRAFRTTYEAAFEPEPRWRCGLCDSILPSSFCPKCKQLGFRA